MFNNKNTFLNVKNIELNELFKKVTEKLFEEGFITDKEQVLEGLKEREKISSTLFENKVGIPHASCDAIKETTLFLVTSKEGITYDNGDDAQVIVFILTPKNAGNEHITMMGKLSSVLLDQENINLLLNTENLDEINKLFSTKEEVETKESKGLIIACTGCAVGVAHTYLAADALKKAGDELGYEVKVETNGSIGVENSPTKEEIKKAKSIIIASDKSVEMKRFNGKKLLQTGVKQGVNNPEKLILDSLEADIYTNINTEEADENTGKGIYKHLMSGVSMMIPFVVVGGLFLALSLAIGGTPTENGLVIQEGSFLSTIFNVGLIGFSLMLPILAGYIAYSIAGQAALAPAMIGGWIANNGSFYNSEVGMGFIGAILAGFLAGYLVKYIKKIKFPEMIRPLVPIMIIPLLGTFIIAIVFIYILGAPVAFLVNEFYSLLESLSTGSWVILGIVIGAMQGFDYGGTLGKIAFLFSIAMIGQGHPEFMGAQAMAIPVAPLGLGLATKLDVKKKLFSKDDNANGTAALAMGLVGISEGAIPFAAENPLVIIPSTMVGSIVAATMGFGFGITNPVPHGGPIVLILGIVNKPLLGLLCMITGAVVTAFMVITLLKIQRNKR